MNEGNPKHCLICESDDYKVIFSYDTPDNLEEAVGVGKKGYFRKWVECKQCGFYYSVYSRGKEVMDRVYVEAYRNNAKSWRKEGSAEEVFDKIIALPEHESVTKLRIKWIKENMKSIWEGALLKAGEPPYNMLDIGGGTGIFAHEFQDANWKSHIIDPSTGNDFIETKLHIPLVRDFYKPKTFTYTFNLISLIYILEHLTDPVTFLKNVHADLAPNGFLFVEVPEAINFKLRPQNDDIFHSEHLWMFGPKALHLLLDRCGFEVFGLKRLKTKNNHFVMMVLASKK